MITVINKSIRKINYCISCFCYITISLGKPTKAKGLTGVETLPALSIVSAVFEFVGSWISVTFNMLVIRQPP